MNFAQRLRDFAKLNDLKIKDLAEKVNMKPPQLQMYLRGTSPSTETLERFGKVGVNIHWLVTGEGVMYADNEAGRELYKKSPKAQEFDENEKNPNPVVMIPQFQINAAAALPDALREIETDIKQVLSKIQSILQ